MNKFEGQDFFSFSRLRPPLSLAALLLCIPFVEYLFLRLVLLPTLGIHIGWGPVLTDYDLLIPLPVAFLVFVYFHSGLNQLPVRLFKRGVFFNLVAFLGFVLFNAVLHRIKVPMHFGALILWWVWAVTTLASAFFWFKPPVFYFNKQSLWLYGVCTPILLATIIATHGFNRFFSILGPWIAKSLVFFSDLFNVGLIAAFRREAVYLTFQHFNVHVGPTCAGLDGFFLVSHALLVLGLVFRNRLSGFQYAVLVFAGWALMVVLNSFRLIFLFVGGVLLQKWLGPDRGLYIMEKLFHTYAGWAFYCFGIYQVVLLAHNMVSVPKKKTSYFGAASCSN